MKSKIIAISAISAGFITILLTFGAYFSFFDIMCVIFSSIFVLLPTYYNSYKGCFLAYLAGGTLALLCGLGNITSAVFPLYFFFGGLFPVIKIIMQDKNLKAWVQIAVGLPWMVATCYGIYFYYMFVLFQNPLPNIPLWIQNNIYIFIGLFGIAFYFIYDRYVHYARIATNRYVGRIISRKK